MKSFSEYYENKLNNTEVFVCEASLSRMLSHVNQPFAIITAYKAEDDGVKRTKLDNIRQNKNLLNILNSHKMGVHQLIGHWRECSLENTPYNQCPPDKLQDVIERSFFVPMPEEADFDEFKLFITKLGSEFKQNAVIISDGENTNIVDCNTGESIPLGTNVTLGKIGQGYSQHVLKKNVPFVFEGLEQLHGNFARQGATISGIILPPLTEEYKIIEGRVIS